MLIKSRGNKEFDVFLGNTWDNLVRVHKDKTGMKIIKTSPSVHLTSGVVRTIERSFEKRDAYFQTKKASVHHA